MSVEEIKKGLIALSEAEQSEVTAFLFHIRHLMILIIRMLYRHDYQIQILPIG